MHPNGDGSTRQPGQGASYTSTNRGIGTEDALHTHNRMSPSSKKEQKEQNTAICSNMDRTRACHTE